MADTIGVEASFQSSLMSGRQILSTASQPQSNSSGPVASSASCRALQALDDVSSPGYPIRFLNARLNQCFREGSGIDMFHSPANIVLEQILKVVSGQCLSDHELVLCGALMARRDPDFSYFARLCETVEEKQRRLKGHLVIPEEIVLDSMISFASRLPRGLLTTLDHTHAGIRLRAVKALGRLGKQARASLPRLQQTEMRDNNSAVRQAAADSIAMIDRKAARLNW